MVARGETNATPPREPVAECPVPGCGGMVVERPKAYGCDSWKSPRNRGCGYVIWKRPRGSEHGVTVEEAKARIEADRADPDAAGLEPVVGGRAAKGPRTKRGSVDADGAIVAHLLRNAIWTGLDGGDKVTLEIPKGAHRGLDPVVVTGLGHGLGLRSKPLKLWCKVSDGGHDAARASLESRLQNRIRKELAPKSRPEVATTA